MKITPAFSLSNSERKIYYKFSLFANSAEIRYDRREYRTIQGEYMRISKKRFWAVLLLSLAALVAGCSQENHQAERKLSSFEPKEVKELRKKEVAQSDGERSEYFFQQLPEEEQRIYREILEGVQQYQEQIYVSSADNEAIDKTYHAILRDHPEVFWIHNRETTYKTVYSTYTVFEPGYQIGQDEIPAVESEMEAAYQTVAGGLPENAGDYEKAKAVYEYVILNTNYGYSEDDQSLAGVFRDHQAVCAGYAGAVQYLLERLGVECLYVTGDTQESPDGHAWNIANLNGTYYYLDATNGDQPDFLQSEEAETVKDMVLYDYLCPFPEEYESMAQIHTEFSLPDCVDTEYNYYVRNGSCFEAYDSEAIYQYACQQIDQGSDMIQFKFRSRQSYEEAIADLIEGKAVEQIAQYYMSYYGMQQIEYHYGVLEDFNTIYFML